jgi:hypothetical protein
MLNSQKNRNSKKFVIPAQAEIQLFHFVLDPGFRRGDDPGDFLRGHRNYMAKMKTGIGCRRGRPEFGFSALS